MTRSYHEIAEEGLRILNPFSEEKLALLVDLCHPNSGGRVLDLACGKGEMLCQMALRYGIEGVGVDLSAVFLESARKRAAELGVESRLQFLEQDASTFRTDPASYDIVSCIGATWIGSGLAGTLRLMKTMLKAGGLLLVGEPFWNALPPAGASDLFAADPAQFATLRGTIDRVQAEGTELVEMVLANADDWDRYQASQWRNMTNWLAANEAHPDANGFRRMRDEWQHAYLDYGRQRWGWGVFVLRVL